MKILITNTFKKSAKKLRSNQKKILKDTINEISKNPEIGELKKGDLAKIRVYKFYILKQQILLAHLVFKKELTLLSLTPMKTFIVI